MEKVLFLFMRRMRRPLIMLICTYALAIGGLVLIPGQDDAGNVWHYDFFHAFYFISFVGPTIGFGEIPYELLPAQRFWVVLSLYLTVIAWLYSIGKIFGLVQEPAFTRALEEARFIRGVRRLGEPFHIICGYGETGSLIVEALSARGWRCVVLDAEPERLDDLELAGLPLDIPRLCADSSATQVLIEAGIKLKNCQTVIAVTNSDEVNTKIAVTVKLLVPDLVVMCRAESSDAVENMASFNTNYIVNPYEVFAEHMGLAIRKPHVNELHRWLGARAGRRLRDPLNPPQGHWIIGGYGRFGQACRRYLEASDLQVSVIERDASRFEEVNCESLKHRIVGSATDPEPLHAAGVESCNGIIAGTDSDTDNLSIVLTAKAINPKIYAVARLNRRAEAELFGAAKLPLVVEPSRIVAWRMLPLAINPMLSEFLALSRNRDDEWAAEFMQRLRDVFNHRSPEIVALRLSGALTSGLCAAIRRRIVRVSDLTRNAQGEPIPVIGLMVRTKEEAIVCPGEGQTLQLGDELLLAVDAGAAHRFEWLVQHSAHWASPKLTMSLLDAITPGSHDSR